MNDAVQNSTLAHDTHQPASTGPSSVPLSGNFAAEFISPSGIFNLTDRLHIFSYLVAANRVRWYRVIMRFFLHCHRELYRYQLTAQEIRDAVRTSFDSDYTLEQCQNDLVALKEWGNVTTLYDSSRATSIASFLSPSLLYQASPEAIAIETFLEEQTRTSASKGALRQGDLPRLWASLQTLDAALHSSVAALTATQGREIAEEWQRAFEVWNTMAREAAQYLANMIQARQGRPDLEAYQLYKAAVVAYVHGFAQALTLFSRRIRELLATWGETGKITTLVTIVAQYLEPPTANRESRPTQEELLQDARHQIEAVQHWFAVGNNADTFRRNALNEVDKVVRQAAVLASSARPNANYATSLDRLAHLLFVARDGDVAQQLFTAAFAHALPLHVSESLIGAPSAAYEPDQPNAWQEPPTVSLHLRPVSRAFRGDPTVEDPMVDNRAAIRAMLQEQEERLREQRERFARLFSTPLLDIGSLAPLAIEERTILIAIIDGCLSTSSHQYRSPDGSTIALLNPREHSYTFLRSSDGMLMMPRYRLQRVDVDVQQNGHRKKDADDAYTD